MAQSDSVIVDMAHFAQCRARLRHNFARTFGYLRDDGLKSIAVIEKALRMGDAIGMIGPAEMIKTEAYELGAVALAEMAEDIEFGARDRVEWRQSPDDLLESVVALRDLFAQTVEVINREINPLMAKRPEAMRARSARF
ncbi:MAG: Hpt domain-containing protein [Sphingomonadaceae bacterium]